MPAVMSKAAFNQRTLPLHTNLTLLAEKRVGYEKAGDVVSETLITAWQSIADFNAGNEQPALLAWLHSILQFKLTQFICDQVTERETCLPAATLFELCDGPDAPAWNDDSWLAQRAEMYRRVHNATLTPRERDFTLRWLGGETLREIGATQEVRISATAVHYVIKRVEKLLQQVDDADVQAGDTRECLRNLPACLSIEGQEMLWKRARREANDYAQRHGIQRAFARTGGC